jgi:hypothetical protein
MNRTAIRTCVTLASTLTLALGLSACEVESKDDGGSSAPAKAPDYNTRVNHICHQTNVRFKNLLDNLHVATTIQEGTAVEKKSVRLFEKEANDIDALKEPRKLRKAVAALVDAIEGSAATINSEGEQSLEGAGTFDDVRKKAKRLGLTECGKDIYSTL